IFIRARTQLNSYVLRSGSKTKAAGYILNSHYNWQHLPQRNGTPKKQEGASIIIPGMQTGNYTVKFFSCSTGARTGELNISANGNTLIIPLPEIVWDLSFITERND